MICCVVGCTNKQGKDSPLTFHHIPRIWNKHGNDSLIISMRGGAIKRSDINVNVLHHIVCCVHFVSGKPSSVDWVPSLNMGYGDVETSTAHVVSPSASASDKAAWMISRKWKFESEPAAQASSYSKTSKASTAADSRRRRFKRGKYWWKWWWNEWHRSWGKINSNWHEMQGYIVITRWNEIFLLNYVS